MLSEVHTWARCEHGNACNASLDAQVCGVEDDALYGILCGQFGDYGELPSKGSFVVHAGVSQHYIDGG